MIRVITTNQFAKLQKSFRLYVDVMVINKRGISYL